MSLICPKCNDPVTFASARGRFACPNCQAKLRARTAGPVVVGIVLWTLIDLVVYPIVYSTFGSEWPATLLRVIVSGAIGIPLLLALVGAFGTVEFDTEESA